MGSESGLSIITPGTVPNRLAVWKEEAGWESPVPLQPSPVVEPRLANSRIDTGADGCGGAEKDGLQEEAAANQEEEEEIDLVLCPATMEKKVTSTTMHPR